MRVHYPYDTSAELARLLVDAAGKPRYDRIFLFADETTASCCLPRLQPYEDWCFGKPEVLTMPCGDVAKNLDTLVRVWEWLGQKGASRHSVLVNVGGGVVTDLGGFAAASFKRGIDFVNIPTTLLAMVDAAVGGKTGINFGGLKNEIGAFRPASAVLIDTKFLSTLDDANLRSGYAEMLKHALLSDVDMWAEHLQFDLMQPDLKRLADLVRRSIETKERIVAQDPTEKGLRKALNLGHTFGHAFESFALRGDHPVLHGYAVAWGLVCELYLSAVKLHFPTDRLHQTLRFIREIYGRPSIDCKDYEALLELLRHDKKNAGGVINFTLLADVGQVQLDCHASCEEIFEAFDFLREG